MAKKRMVDPQIWSDSKFVALEPLARLLFIGMWNFACDNGHLDDDVLQLKMRVLPADDCDVQGLVDALLASGRVARKDGYLKVVNLNAHQTPDLRFLVFCDHCDADPDRHYSEADRRARKGGTQSAPSAPQEHAPSAPRNGGVGVDGGVDGGGSASAPSRRSPERPLPADWQPTDAHRKYAAENRLDLDREAFKFRNHAAANDRRQRNWNATFTTWLAKSTEWAPKAAVRTDLPEAWR